MLATAREKAVHRRHDLIEHDEPLAFLSDTDSAIGVLGEVSVPVGLFDKLPRRLAKSHIPVCFRDDLARRKSGAIAYIHEHVDSGSARPQHVRQGARLPASHLKSTIQIPEKI